MGERERIISQSLDAAKAAAAKRVDSPDPAASCQWIAAAQVACGDVPGAIAWARVRKEPQARAAALCGAAKGGKEWAR